METAEIVIDGFERIRDLVHSVADGLTDEQLAHRVDGTSNSIAWLLWHLTRVQDDHLAEAAGLDQVWLSGDWRDRFELPLEATDIGYGHSSDQVGKVASSAELLVGYHDAVFAQTQRIVRALSPQDFDTVVDDRWDPPVTMGVRLMSVLSDDLQHVGQAAFVRGLL
jgi:hypothetical protein